MSKDDCIKDFVQNILGCTCPDKVFEHIEDRRVASLSSPHTRCITIGGRLLIYIWNIKDVNTLRENLAALLVAGRKERDDRGLNRFRAVLAVDNNPAHFAAETQRYFSEFADRDERIHLHVVASADLEGI